MCHHNCNWVVHKLVLVDCVVWLQDVFFVDMIVWFVFERDVFAVLIGLVLEVVVLVIHVYQFGLVVVHFVIVQLFCLVLGVLRWLDF